MVEVGSFRESYALEEEDLRAEFDRIALPHLDAAYNLARWLTRHDHDAEDVVQEAYLRALQFFRGFHGDTGRAWMLQIVRNTCYTWLEKNRSNAASGATPELFDALASAEADPAKLLERREEQQSLMQAIAVLPLEFREIVVLRELEGLSYKEIARIAEIRLGTVMSRLARARERLHELLDRPTNDDGSATQKAEGNDGLP
jgi:RNA polymerase sigma-70 factor (ECF subfamily)